MSAAERPRPQDASPIGPVQIHVLGFVEDDFASRILPELRRLRDLGHVRLLDLLVVRKDERGEIEPQSIADLDETEAREFGALVGALVGLGPGGDDDRVEAQPLDDESVWYLTDAIPAGRTAAIVLGKGHHGRLGRWLGTDVAQEVERSTDCPVIVVD